MISAFTVLFHLGLSVEPRTTAVTGKFSIPTIWAEPDSVVTKGQSVTIWCLGSHEAQEYYLYKGENSKPWKTQILLKAGNKVNFSFPSVTEYHAGQYHCYYYSPAGWSNHSDFLELVVTGFYRKPNISALPSFLVTSGGTVTLQCSSHQGYEKYILIKEGEQNIPLMICMTAQNNHRSDVKALFSVGPVTPSSSGAFKCYGYYKTNPQVWSEPSDQLEIHISALLGGGCPRKPIHLTQQNYAMTPRETLIIHYSFFDADYERAFLAKKEETYLSLNHGLYSQVGLSQANFTLGPVNSLYEFHHRLRGMLYTQKNQSDRCKGCILLCCVRVSIGLFKRPLIWLERGKRSSGKVISGGTPMTIWCQGILDVNIYALNKGADSPMVPLTQWKTTNLLQALLSLALRSKGLFSLVSLKIFSLFCISLFRSFHAFFFSSCSETPERPLQLVQSIYYSKPNLTALPSPVVTSGENMTLQCVSWWKYEKFILSKEDQKFLRSQDSQYIPSIQQYHAFFSIDQVTTNHTGTFRCYGYYRNTPHLWSVASDPLELHISGKHNSQTQDQTVENLIRMGIAGLILIVLGILIYLVSWTQKRFVIRYGGECSVQLGSQEISKRLYLALSTRYPPVHKQQDASCAGTLHKPTIKAEPGSMVTLGRPMTIWCQGTLNAEFYVLRKLGSQKSWASQTPEKPENKAKFSIPSVTQEHGGQYRCYYYSSAGWTERSDPLELVVTGIYNVKPILSGLPSPVVTSGGNMTLQCVSQERYDNFILTRKGQKYLSSLNSSYKHNIMQYEALFPIDHATPEHRGTYRCYGYYKDTPQLWSIPSEPLEINISGLSKKPSLLTLQGHILDPGRSLTLQCCSDINYDKFVLYKLDGDGLTLHDGQRTQAGLSCANFTLGPVSSSTAGQYRCYGAHNLSSEWSASSDPLDILITGQTRGDFQNLMRKSSMGVRPPLIITLVENRHSLRESESHIRDVCSMQLTEEGDTELEWGSKETINVPQVYTQKWLSSMKSTFSGGWKCYSKGLRVFFCGLTDLLDCISLKIFSLFFGGLAQSKNSLYIVSPGKEGSQLPQTSAQPKSSFVPPPSRRPLVNVLELYGSDEQVFSFFLLIHCHLMLLSFILLLLLLLLLFIHLRWSKDKTKRTSKQSEYKQQHPSPCILLILGPCHAQGPPAAAEGVSEGRIRTLTRDLNPDQRVGQEVQTSPLDQELSPVLWRPSPGHLCGHSDRWLSPLMNISLLSLVESFTVSGGSISMTYCFCYSN
ncbi:Leukocyte immunoglobulin-like receptor subfamily B member 3, partial [Sigmodon hispidus]